MTMAFRRLWDASEPASFKQSRNVLRARAARLGRGVDVVLLLDLIGRRYTRATAPR